MVHTDTRYCHTDITDTITPTIIFGDSFDTSGYTSITFTYSNCGYGEEKKSDEEINYWHAIELKSYWYQPKKIGKPFRGQTKPLKVSARNKLRKHKLKPELCLK